MIKLQNKLNKLQAKLNSFVALKMRKQVINTCFEILKIESLIEQLNQINQERTKMTTTEVKRGKDAICRWRDGNYGVKVTVNKMKLNIEFSDFVGGGTKVRWMDGSKTFIEEDELMTALNCQIVDNEWIEISREETTKWEYNPSYEGNRYYYTHPIIKFRNQFGETQIWVNDDRSKDNSLSHPDIKYPRQWRDANGKKIDRQLWCDRAIEYVKDNKHLFS